MSKNYSQTYYDVDELEKFDKYEVFAEQFDPLVTDRQARRKRKPRVNPKASKKSDNEIVADIADATGVEGEFTTTYRLGEYESEWLLASLRRFYDEELISDILAQVKGGKEASVYRCEAHPVLNRDFLAAKVYRPRKFRNLRNDKMYREGRQILTSDGRPVKKTDHRIARAIGKKSDFGVQVEHTSWLMHEYNTLDRLYRAGGAVPEPIAAGDNAILMSYIGDERMAAPTLNQIRLDLDEAEHLYQEVLRNIELMLGFDMIHGDLSAYNILYWQGEITLIDFPQVTHSQANHQARYILQRDITRICNYFAQQGVSTDARAVMDDLWQRYVEKEPHIRAADESRLLMEMAGDEEDDDEDNRERD